MGRPTVHPTGVTLYNPEKAASGYTLFAGPGVGSILIDMNGNVVRVWKNLGGFPPKMLPGGHLSFLSGFLRFLLFTAAACHKSQAQNQSGQQSKKSLVHMITIPFASEL